MTNNRSGRAAIRLQNVGHHFPGQAWLFRSITQEFLPGRSYALTGPSGSGKSTLLSLIAGWESPREGTIHRAEEASVKWVFQNPHGVRNRLARDHVLLPLLARGMTRTRAVVAADQYLESVGLSNSADKRFAELSGGEAQRLMLARGLAAAPDVLLVDEPTAQLDFATGETVNKALVSLKKNSSTVIVATHDERTRSACDEYVDLARFALAFGGSDETF